MMFPARPRNRIWVVALAVALSFGSACKADATDDKQSGEVEAAADELVVYKYETDTHLDLLAPEGEPRELSLGESRRFPECHEIFEPQGSVVERFPASDPVERASMLSGCDPEAYRRTDEHTFIAYRVPRKEAGFHQRFAAFDSDGALEWDYLIDRSENAENFRANFRSGYIVPLLPRLVCAGTLWEGGTRLTCLRADNGQAEFDGLLKFWAGLAPRGHNTSLVTTTISGLTRRYPYSGVEMRFKELPDSGGRSAFYASDGERLLYVPADAPYPRMSAYSFENLEREWVTELPGHPKSHYDDTALDAHHVVLAKADGKLLAVDTKEGNALWTANVGDDTPPMAAVGDSLYLLVRRDTEDNLLYSLGPRTAEIQWWATVPAGTLELRHYDDRLFVRSVRAVRHVPTSSSP